MMMMVLVMMMMMMPELLRYVNADRSFPLDRGGRGGRERGGEAGVVTEGGGVRNTHTKRAPLVQARIGTVLS